MRNLILYTGVMFILSCSIKRKAYYYYEVDDFELFTSEISVNNLKIDKYVFTDTLLLTNSNELILYPKVKYYHKEKNKSYNSSQLGSRGAEEKINKIDFYLLVDNNKVFVKLKPSLNLIIDSIENLPLNVNFRHPNPYSKISSVSDLNDLKNKFNDVDDVFKYSYNVNSTFRFALDLPSNIENGVYDMILKIEFDNGKIINSKRTVFIS